MAKPTKRRIDGDGPAASSRVTAKGGAKVEGRGQVASSRYTPPSTQVHLPSPAWVPGLMFTLFGLGFVGILLNYSEVLPGSPSGWWLLGGLGAILAGIITATQLR
ncbi:MAG: hypothetical protein IT195_00540 [Microthrixaceae bacterium]|nr:hypothetical protein [Microthrixaceae bacterium]